MTLPDPQCSHRHSRHERFEFGAWHVETHSLTWNNCVAGRADFAGLIVDHAVRNKSSTALSVQGWPCDLDRDGLNVAIKSGHFASLNRLWTKDGARRVNGTRRLVVIGGHPKHANTVEHKEGLKTAFLKINHDYHIARFRKRTSWPRAQRVKSRCRYSPAGRKQRSIILWTCTTNLVLVWTMSTARFLKIGNTQRQNLR